MNKAQKAEIIAILADKITRASAIYLADFSGVTVEQDTTLRREFRKAGVDYTVAKNTLIRKAMEQVTGFDKAFDRLVGPTALAISYDELAPPAKIIKETGRKTGKLKLKAALIEKHLYEASSLDMLSNMPSRKDTLAAILGSINAPASNLVGVINAVVRDLVSVIDQVAEQKKAA
jgi:large subunit ribosomal protein L10